MRENAEKAFRPSAFAGGILFFRSLSNLRIKER
jgi:hypothetical protein